MRPTGRRRPGPRAGASTAQVRRGVLAVAAPPMGGDRISAPGSSRRSRRRAPSGLSLSPKGRGPGSPAGRRIARVGRPATGGRHGRHPEPRREHADRRRPPVGLAHGDGPRRPRHRGRQQPPDADRRRRRGTGAVQAVGRGGRLHRRRRYARHHVRHPPRRGPRCADGLCRLAPRHPAHGRQVRRGAGRPRGPGDHSLAQRPRGSAPSTPSSSPTGPTRRVPASPPPCWPRASSPASTTRPGPRTGRMPRARASATSSTASAGAGRSPWALARCTPSSSSTSSRARSWRRRAATSASSPMARGCGGSRSRSGAARAIPAPRPCRCAATQGWGWRA